MKSLAFQGEPSLQAVVQQDSDTKPVCSLPLCGRPAEWEMEMFGKVEFYCSRHRPIVPEKFMSKVNTH